MSNDVTTALVKLVENGGNAAKTARELDMPVDTLRRWRSDTHAERYRQLEVQHGESLEHEAVAQARQNIQRAGEIEADLLERASETKDPNLVPQALRAVSDSKSKNVDKLLALTGRPQRDDRSPAQDFIGLLEAMSKKGYLKINLPTATEGEAEDITDAETVEPPAA